ncbi:dihydroxyacetone kinase family protein [Jonesiaceae bacterium BS-20]|uniref:Dihydroxyacetone kinase family protein n=1 Tax=Jonesiaceae bacterium BS-20 TaxID=3120821 RepID=A0AAU7DRQ6_9MICO
MEEKMSYVLNDPASFADESAAGFVAANKQFVRAVPGGVARVGATPAGQVAVVVGGGSGHYPAFAGLVGPGLAHGAAMGNVFASPSAQQVYSVAKSVATEAGVLLTYGNYAGDVLNFDLAQERLLAEGIPCATVQVTDDIYSAAPEEAHKRRGVAGDLAVFRAAAWAAEQGMSLDEVVEFTAKANDRTRTLGVAFSGCTLPGATEPLFTVPDGKMAVGMGIHGEPGIKTVDIPSANDLAALFVENLLKERPAGIGSADGARVAVILNGLGSIKSEELFVIYGPVARLLEAEGITIVEPEVGEFATSFEMAGVSLTLFWLDEDLEAAWASPVYAPAYRKGAISDLGSQETSMQGSEAAGAEQVPDASPDSALAGQHASAVLIAISNMIDERADELGRLDAIAGDGDHGIGMQRGAIAAAQAGQAAAAAGAGVGTTLSTAGDAWADKAGGTSGALWGAGLRAAGEVLGDAGKPRASDYARAVEAAQNRVQSMGKAEVGDKTMVDAIVPFTSGLTSRVAQDVPLALAWEQAAIQASEAAQATADLLPKLGRARTHSESSVGTPDPGAISFALAMTTAAAVLQQHADKKEN